MVKDLVLLGYAQYEAEVYKDGNPVAYLSTMRATRWKMIHEPIPVVRRYDR